MKYLLTTIYDTNGAPLSIECEKVPEAMTSVLNTTLQFANDQQALEYVNNLRAIWKLPISRGGPSKSVKCRDTGEIFPSAAAAARSAGCSTSYMVRRIAQRGDVKGANYEYVTE